MSKIEDTSEAAQLFDPLVEILEEDEWMVVSTADPNNPQVSAMTMKTTTRYIPRIFFFKKIYEINRS